MAAKGGRLTDPEKELYYRNIQIGECPPPGAVSTTREAGVLGVVPGVLGAIQATEAIKYPLDRGRLLVGRLLTWDALSMTFHGRYGAGCVGWLAQP